MLFYSHTIMLNIFLDHTVMTHKLLPIAIWGMIFIALIHLLGLEGNATVTTSMKKNSSEMLEKIGISKDFRAIDLGGYKIKLGFTSSGQTLSSIMASQKINNKIIHKASQNAKNVFRLNGLQSGVSYIVARQAKDPFNIKYLILNVFPDRSFVVDFENQSDVFWGKVKTDKYSKRVAGNIQSSFWKTMKNHGVETKHILQLMTLFNTRIKFSKMTTQDYFDITYEEHKTDSTVIKTGDILSVIMSVNGSTISAYRFEHHGVGSYYDETGRNLSSSFLKSPVQYKKITSRFSAQRNHPILKMSKSHLATDFGAPEGAPVMSIGDGVIEKIGYSNTAGNFIEVNHPNSYKTRYLHLSAFADDIQNGSEINKGSVIGYVGSTGIATGPHLDFRISKNGQFIDFLSENLPEGKPVDKDCSETFKKIVQKYNKEIKKQENI